MFENVLRGTKVRKTKRWKTFGGKDASRWKREGSVQSMTRSPRSKRSGGRRKKGNWGTWEQRWWQAGEPNHPYHHG